MEKKDNISSAGSIIDSIVDGTASAEQKHNIKVALDINSRKAEALKAVRVKAGIDDARQSGRVVRMWPRRMMRYAAILLPFLVIGLVWAGNTIGLFSFGNSDAASDAKADAMKSVAPADMSADIIRFESADINMVTTTLMEHYPQIKGVKDIDLLTDDSVRITTTFDSQPLSEVLEELNIHFNHTFALDNDGNLTVSE
ncbi:MAG: hypothetical protein MJZ15_02255 [Bacteroidales bacterium]|nr:hypothetical protein [Bacteroidales bacterium]